MDYDNLAFAIARKQFSVRFEVFTAVTMKKMLRHVALVRTDVSEELSASFIRVTISELGTTVAVTSNRRTLQRNSNSQQNLLSKTFIKSQAYSFHYISLPQMGHCRSYSDVVQNR
jgi:hypothetical protein